MTISDLIRLRRWLMLAVAAVCVAGLLAACLPAPAVSPQPAAAATPTLRPTFTAVRPTATTAPATAAAAPPPTATPQATAPAAGQPTTEAQARKQVMASLAPQVRHWKGDPQARVTIIDFSDFQ